MRLCHLLLFVNEKKKAPLDVDWSIRSACLSKMEDGREGEKDGRMDGEHKNCFYALRYLIGLFCIYFSRGVRKENITFTHSNAYTQKKGKAAECFQNPFVYI